VRGRTDEFAIGHRRLDLILTMTVTAAAAAAADYQ
jgi:hypothetical protein